MFNNIFSNLTLLAALGSGVMAGVFFIFSNTVMSALGQLKPAEGIAAMQAINKVILNPLFFVAFIGTGIVCLGLALSLFWSWPATGAGYLLAGCLIYIAGSFVVTMVFNVPMNDALDAVSASSTEAADLWATYLVRWTLWNHVRTAASFLSAAALTLSLI
ncbi:MAG: DUF1772 domain-containing protein [Anaerolineae bacterium]